MELRAHTGQYGKQSLAITARMIQSIRLLQYGQEELSEFVTNQAERNPLIKVLVEDCSANWISTASPTAAAGGALAAGMKERATERVGYGRTGSAAYRGEDLRTIADLYAARTSLRDHLIEQAAISFDTMPDRLIAGELVEAIDSDGYIRANLDQISERLGTTREKVDQILGRLQHFDPAGVGARDLAECLALQLRERGRLDAPMRAMLDNLPLLAACEMDRLARACGVSSADAAAMAKEIRSLDPRPGRRFDTDPVPPALPDVIIQVDTDGSIHVELNTAVLPKVLVDRQYYSRLKAGHLGVTEKRFVMDCMRNATWLVQNLDQRAQTMLKVATEIVMQQQAFFAQGITGLRPLALSNVAQAIGVHESTVCRAVANKHILTDRGLFPLKYFFSGALSAVDLGEDGHSVETVRQKIRSMVAVETPDNILSDEALVVALRRDGVNIARRTVAKYREMLQIPHSRLRRRQMRYATL